MEPSPSPRMSLNVGENLTGTRHPSRQAMEEEGAEGPVSLDK